MNKFSSILIPTLLFCLSSLATAEQFKVLGQWHVHYIAFPSTFITPDIASTLGIQRSGSVGIINISVLDKDSQQSLEKIKIKGIAKNLLGNQTALTFQRVTQGDSTYFLAPIKFYSEETFTFELTISDNRHRQKLEFKHQFFPE